jgi:ubiquitin carboxyl-terminal hydrolase 36/42
MFQRVIKYRIVCQDCKKAKDSARDNCFVTVGNPSNTRGAQAVTRGIEDNMQDDSVDGWHCDNCDKNVMATRRGLIRDGPEILLLQINRFLHHESGGIGKMGTKVLFGEDLDLTSLLETHQIRAGETLHYQLVTVIVHCDATTKAGHYTSYVKGLAGTWS